MRTRLAAPSVASRADFGCGYAALCLCGEYERAQYGERLICVRYRYDETRRVRIKTVELIEEESPWTPAGAGAVYLVRIDYDETALRARVKEAGGRWNAQRKLWLVTRDTLRRLSLEDRIVAWLPHE